MAERKYFSANTVEQAVLQAARHYQILPENLAYEQIEKRHGFVRNRKRVLIRVDPAAPSRAAGASPSPAPTASAPEPTPGPAPRQPEPEPEASMPEPDEPEPEASMPKMDEPEPEVSTPETDEPVPEPEPELSAPEPDEPEPEASVPETDKPVPEPEPEVAASASEVPPVEEIREPAGVPEVERSAELDSSAPARPERPSGKAYESQAAAALEAIRQLFELADLDLEATVEEGEEGLLELEITGPDQELLLHDRGRLLLSCQHLLPRMIRGLTGEASPCRLDSDNFHELRAERLRDLAQRVASEVRNEGRAKTLDPMAPDERRIVHMTLADDVGVTTESKGQGLFKRVVVSPAGRGEARNGRGGWEERGGRGGRGGRRGRAEQGGQGGRGGREGRAGQQVPGVPEVPEEEAREGLEEGDGEESPRRPRGFDPYRRG
jgi:spoIIIJ-associated protein